MNMLARIVTGIVLLAGVARAQPAPPAPPGVTAPAPLSPHQGLYLRLMLGGGYDQMTNSQPMNDIKIHGGAVALDIHIGYFVMPNLAIGADLFGSGVAGPSVSINGMDVMASSSAQLTFTNIGAGATYFVPEVNAYASAAFGIARGSVDDGSGGMSTSPSGWGAHLLLGKEWWVSPHWGVGLAGDFFYVNLPDTNNSTDTAVGGGLVFSSSYSGGPKY
jgi:hypothetical protein